MLFISTNQLTVEHIHVTFDTLLAESLRSRKIEGDSVRRVDFRGKG